MGSGASATASEIPGGDLRLPTTGLKFSINQLRSLNAHVETLFDEDQKAGISAEVESAVESLVQRIVDGAGQRDPRFRCCHLIALHRGKKMRSRSLEYLVTLDSLPPLNSGNDDCRLQAGPLGFGKIRLSGREVDRWQEFLTPSGYLSRDKLVERWVELVARCTQPRGGGSSRVLCAGAARRAEPYHYCYLQKSSPSQPPDTRLAIVEGATWVLVRCGAAQAEAKLLLGARVQGCDPAAYTIRVPLADPMAMLHYTVAQGGYYAVAIGPPTSTSASERPGTWQLWQPALEAALDGHCADASAVGRVAGALNVLVDHMRDGRHEGRLRAVSRYSVASLLRARLSRRPAASIAARGCGSAHMAHQLLLVLDTVVSVCERGLPPGFTYPLARGALSRRGAADDHWVEDAACVRSCLLHLLTIAGADEIPQTPAESLEMAMFARWDNLNRESKAGTSSVPTYSRRQLQYLWRVARELVKCKEMVVYENHSVFKANLIQASSQHDEELEQLIHMAAIMLDQARDLYLNNCQQGQEFSRDLSAYRSKKWKKLRDYYDASSSCLIDAIRRDPDLRNTDLTEPVTLMKNLLDWLYKGAKEDKKYLGPVLKRYLDSLFLSSLENCWFLEEFDSKRSTKEMEGLKEYCMGVHNGKVDPCLGLMDAAKKMAWAKTVVDFVERFRHVEFRLIFPTGDGLAISYVIKLPSRRDNKESRTLTLSRKDKADAKTRLAKRAVVSAFTDVICGYRGVKPKLTNRHGSSEEILASVKSGQYWKNSKPDIIPNTNTLDKDFSRTKRRSRRNRPVTSYGFPEISVSKESDAKTMRRKYHTLRSLVYTDGGEGLKEARRRPRSAGSTVRSKEPMSRPSILETLDFINSVKDALYVEESGTSDIEESWSGEEEYLISLSAPLNSIARGAKGDCTHWALGSHVVAALHRGSFSMLQELCAWLGDSSEGALFALHRLARAARSRSTEREASTWKLGSTDELESQQRYKPRPLDYTSGDDAPQPPPLPRLSIKDNVAKRYSSYVPPNRLHELEQHLTQLESIRNKLSLAENNQTNFNQTNFNQAYFNQTYSNQMQLNQSQFNLNQNYTGIINPIYDIKLPKSKFSVKRSKSLGRNDSVKSLDLSKYNLTLGYRSGKTNDVVTAISEMTAETGLDVKGNFFQRYSTAEVVGDAYRVSRATIE